MGAMRIPVTYPLESRDGTLARDAKLKNMVTEIIEGKPWAVKRPGISSEMEPVTGGAQGVVSLNGKPYAIFNDILYFIKGDLSGINGGYNMTNDTPLPSAQTWVQI